MRVPENIVEQIRTTADIVDVIEEYVPLKKAGNRFVGLCPFHEDKKSPSFSVSRDKGLYHCFGCKKSGNVFSFLKDYLGLNFNESLEYLAKRYSIALPQSSGESEKMSQTDLAFKALTYASDIFESTLLQKSGEVGLKYFKKRDFTIETIKKFNLGYAPDSYQEAGNQLRQIGFTNEVLESAGLIIRKEDGKTYDRFRGRVMFAIKDFVGRIVGFGARQLKDEENQPKYINSPQSLVYDKSKVLYGLFEAKNAIRNAGYAILVEGYADTLTLHQAGIANVIASSGTALTIDQLKLLSRYTNTLYLIFDSDQAGKKATDRGIELALKLGYDVRIVRLPSGEDPDSLIRNNNKQLFESHLRANIGFIDYLVESKLQEGTLDSPLKKADFTRFLMGLISTIPDRLQHDFYIGKLSSLLDLSESQLRMIYNDKNKNEAAEERKYNSEPYEEYHEQNSLTHQELPPQPVQEEILDMKTLLPEEEIILIVALQGPKFHKAITEKYCVTESNFISEAGKLLFSTIHDYTDSLNIAQEMLESEEYPEFIINEVAELSLGLDKPSEKWQDFGSLPTEPNLLRMVQDSLIRLEIKYIETELGEVQKQLREKHDEDVFSMLLMRMTELTNLRNTKTEQLIRG